MGDNRKRRYAAALAIMIMAEEEQEREEKRRKIRRTIWMHDWLGRRLQRGVHENIFEELHTEDPATFKEWCRMDKATFDFILHKIKPYISRQETLMRDTISASARLLVTIEHLATGLPYNSLRVHHRISPASLSIIIPEVCEAIYHALQPEFLAVPNTPEKWTELADMSEALWNFPNCIGAIDGKHVLIEPPKELGSMLHNYKGTNSIVFMAVVDADYKIIFMDVGAYGRMSDGGIWAKTKFKSALENGTLNLPQPRPLEPGGPPIPFTIVGDAAFPLREYLMRPYPAQTNTAFMEFIKLLFNYRLSRERRVSENCFGHLVNRWQILRSPMRVKPEKAITICKALAVLHNVLRSRSSRPMYTPPDAFDREDVMTGEITPGAWRSAGTGNGTAPFAQTGTNYSLSAKEIRDYLADYFAGPGAVPWQDHSVRYH